MDYLYPIEMKTNGTKKNARSIHTVQQLPAQNQVP